MVSVCSLKSAETEQFNKIAGLLALASSPRDKAEKTNPKPQNKYFCESGTFTGVPWGGWFDSCGVGLQAGVEVDSF